MLLSETGGTWEQAVELAPPANAAPDPKVERYGQGALSCPSAGNCTAVGGYTDSSGDTEGFMLSETEGTWGTAVEAIMPAGARSEPDASFQEVQCPSAGNCTAAGVYAAANSEESDGVFLTETAGVWGASVERPLPANAAPQLVIEGSLSCPSAGDCSYVGNYKVNEFVSRALLETENDGTWGTGINGTLPANVTGDPGAFLSSVSCTSPGNCTAVGSYNSYTDQLRRTAGPAVHRHPRHGEPLRERPARRRLRRQPDLRLRDLRDARGRVRPDRDDHVHRVRPPVLAAQLVYVGRHHGRRRACLRRRDLPAIRGLHPAQPRRLLVVCQLRRRRRR